jgi:hypothetical protein
MNLKELECKGVGWIHVDQSYFLTRHPDVICYYFILFIVLDTGPIKNNKLKHTEEYTVHEN